MPGGAKNAVFDPGAAAAHGAAACVARHHVEPLPAPITMPVHQTEVPLTTAGRTATFTLVEFPEDRHFIDIAMKNGKWFVLNERAFFFMRPPECGGTKGKEENMCLLS